MRRRVGLLPGAFHVSAGSDRRRSWTLDLLILLTLSGAARAVLFSGFVGGDDFAYAALAHDIVENRYPAVEPNVFAARPVLMLPIATSIAILGWTEWALTLPVLLGSLSGIGCTYALGRLLAGRAAGLCASATLAVFPLDLVYATTTTNDIVGSAVIASAMVLGVLSFQTAAHERRRVAILLAMGAGFTAGLAPGVKLSMVLGLVPPALIVVVLAALHRDFRTAAVCVLVGLGCGQLLLAVFFWYTSGAMLANYAVELGFNRTFMAQPYLDARADALLAYPRWTFGIRPAVSDVDWFFPYGLFFPVAVLSGIASLRWSSRWTWLLMFWFTGVVLLMEFWPLQMFPAYIPIHRLPRFLHLAAVPGALLIGTACVSAVARGGLTRVAAIAVWAVYLLHSVGTSVIAAERHRDSMQDLRFAATISSHFPGPVVSDAEMRGYLMFRRGFRDQERMRKLLGAQVIVPPRSMVIVGGGRRIDMDPDWTERRVPEQIPDDWLKIADLPGTPRPWRRQRGAVYVSVGAAKLTAKGFAHAIGATLCGGGVSWRLVDVLDVGDRTSEAAHGYRIEEQTFFGERMMYVNGGELEDDGRAFRHSQTFEVSKLTPKVPVCLVKRVDPGARRQVSRWFAGENTIATVTVDTDDVSEWHDAAIHIPPDRIPSSRLRLTERFVSAAVDVNSYRIEIYQRDQ
jgi:4-amino-4-deoxy-L-arabinose transferase-like glycosyltransferase